LKELTPVTAPVAPLKDATVLAVVVTPVMAPVKPLTELTPVIAPVTPLKLET
jgi:hypothetical protein